MILSDARVDAFVEYVREQLPRTLRDRLQVELRSDPFHLVTKARFGTQDGRTFDCALETELVAGRVMACRIPVDFIAHLSVVV